MVVLNGPSFCPLTSQKPILCLQNGFPLPAAPHGRQSPAPRTLPEQLSSSSNPCTMQWHLYSSLLPRSSYLPRIFSAEHAPCDIHGSPGLLNLYLHCLCCQGVPGVLKSCQGISQFQSPLHDPRRPSAKLPTSQMVVPNDSPSYAEPHVFPAPDNIEIALLSFSEVARRDLLSLVAWKN